MFKNFLVVCTGNICRSPIMEGLLKARLAQHSGIRVTSAGIAALVGRPADPLAIQVMLERGIDIADHRAQQLDEKMLFDSDLVFVMERNHLIWVEGNHPAARGRVFLAGHWKQAREVPDPYMQSKLAFEQSYSQLSECVEDWATKLKFELSDSK